MGLDQYLYERTPRLDDPLEIAKDEIAYWRKDWDLQQFLNTGNGEVLDLTEEICDDVLSNLDNMYLDIDPDNRERLQALTEQAFIKAKELLAQNKRITYEPDW